MVIPAHDEEALIGRCLASVTRAMAHARERPIGSGGNDQTTGVGTPEWSGFLLVRDACEDTAAVVQRPKVVELLKKEKATEELTRIERWAKGNAGEKG